MDIVHWGAEPEKFVAAALGPATVVSVAIDSDTRTAHVRVPKDQVSLAIGRDGQNARLAFKLTGWRVDVDRRGPRGVNGRSNRGGREARSVIVAVGPQLPSPVPCRAASGVS